MWTMLLASNPVPKPTPHVVTRSVLRLELVLHRRQQLVYGTINVLVNDKKVEALDMACHAILLT